MAGPRELRISRWAGACGTAVSCLLTMVLLPLGAAGTAASAAAGMGAMAGMASPAPGDGSLAVAAQGLLILSLPLMVAGLWPAGWGVRALASGSGAALYSSMYWANSLALFGLAGAGLTGAYLLGRRRIHPPGAHRSDQEPPPSADR